MKVGRRPKVIVPLVTIATLMAVFQPGIGYISASNDTPQATFCDPKVGVEVTACATEITEPAPVKVEATTSLGDDQEASTVQNVSSEPEVSTEVEESKITFEKQWALERIAINELWQNTTGSEEILVAILDTGIDSSHEDLEGQVADEINFVDSGGSSDGHGHGTHIAGIVCAKSNDIGITGVAPGSRLLNVRVADDKGRCRASDLADGVNWAADNGASIINISIEIGEPSPELARAIDYAWEKGCLIIAAAGNDGSSTEIYPAGYENCMAVAATDLTDGLAILSNHGDWVNVAAPGFAIYSTLPDDQYGMKTGTSFACACVSGMAALLYDIAEDTNDNGRINDEVRAAIKDGCQAIDVEGVESGRIDAQGAMAQIYLTQ